ncbi:MAG: hypothetical protein HQK77_05675 [Desulfobacterales bacterium]|nr:hypothetical protein [Desulfobacterales bacterium]
MSLTINSNSIQTIYPLSQSPSVEQISDIEIGPAVDHESSAIRLLYDQERQVREETFLENETKLRERFEQKEASYKNNFSSIEEKKLSQVDQYLEKKRARFNSQEAKLLNDFQGTEQTQLNKFNRDEEKQLLSYKRSLGLKSTESIEGDSRFDTFLAEAEKRLEDFEAQASARTETFNTETATRLTAFEETLTTERSEFLKQSEERKIAFDLKAAERLNDYNEKSAKRYTSFNKTESKFLDDLNSRIASSLNNYNSYRETQLDRYNDQMNAQLTDLISDESQAINDYALEEQGRINDFSTQEAKRLENFEKNEATQLSKINQTPDSILKDLKMTDSDRITLFNQIESYRKALDEANAYYDLIQNKWSFGLIGNEEIEDDSRFTAYQASIQEQTLTINAPEAIEEGDIVQVDIGGVTVTTAPLTQGSGSSEIAAALKTAIDAKIDDPNDHDFDNLIGSKNAVSQVNNSITITGKDSNADISLSNYQFNQQPTNNLMAHATADLDHIQESKLTIATPFNIENGDTVQVDIGGISVSTASLAQGASSADIADALKTAIDAKLNNSSDHDFDSRIASTSNVVSSNGVLTNGVLTIQAKDVDADVTFSNYSLNEFASNNTAISSATPETQNFQQSSLTINSATNIEDGDKVQIQVGTKTVTTSSLLRGTSSSGISTALKTAIDAKISNPNDHDFDDLIASTDDVLVNGNTLTINAKTPSSTISISNYSFLENTATNLASTATISSIGIQESKLTISGASNIQKSDTVQVKIGNITVTTAALSDGGTPSNIASALKTAIDAKINNSNDHDFDNLIASTSDVIANTNPGELIIIGKDTNANVTFSNLALNEYSPANTGVSTATTSSSSAIEVAELTIDEPTTATVWGDTAQIKIGDIIVTTGPLEANSTASDIANVIREEILEKIYDFSDHDFDETINDAFGGIFVNSSGVFVEDNVLTIRSKTSAEDVEMSNYAINGTGVGTSTPSTGTIQEVTLTLNTPTAIQKYDTAQVQVGGITVTTAELSDGATASDIASALKTAITNKIKSPTDHDFDDLIADVRDVRVDDNKLTIWAKNSSSDITLSNYALNEYQPANTGSISGTIASDSIPVQSLTLAEPQSVETGDTFKVTIGGINVTTGALTAGADAQTIASAFKTAIDAKITNPSDHDFDTLIASTNDVTTSEGVLTIRAKDKSANITLSNYGFTEAAPNNTGNSTGTASLGTIQQSVLTIAEPVAIEEDDEVSVSIGGIRVTTGPLSEADNAESIATALQTAIQEKIANPNDHDFDTKIASVDDVVVNGGQLTIKSKGPSIDVSFSNYALNEYQTQDTGISTATAAAGNIQQISLTIDNPIALEDGDTLFMNIGGVSITTPALQNDDLGADIALILKSVIDSKLSNPNDHDLDSLIASSNDVTVNGNVLKIKAKDTNADIEITEYGVNELNSNNIGQSTAQITEQMVTPTQAQFNMDSSIRRQEFISSEQSNRDDHLNVLTAQRLQFELDAANQRNSFIADLINDRANFIQQMDSNRTHFIQNESALAQKYEEKIAGLYQKVSSYI